MSTPFDRFVEQEQQFAQSQQTAMATASQLRADAQQIHIETESSIREMPEHENKRNARPMRDDAASRMATLREQAARIEEQARHADYHKRPVPDAAMLQAASRHIQQLENELRQTEAALSSTAPDEGTEQGRFAQARHALEDMLAGLALGRKKQSEAAKAEAEYDKAREQLAQAERAAERAAARRAGLERRRDTLNQMLHQAREDQARMQAAAAHGLALKYAAEYASTAQELMRLGALIQAAGSRSNIPLLPSSLHVSMPELPGAPDTLTPSPEQQTAALTQITAEVG